MARFRSWRGLLLLLVLLACGSGNEPPPVPLEAPDPAKLRDSDGGLYRVSLRPESGEPPLQRLHRWVLHIEDRKGGFFVPTRIQVSGGMPQHGHGLPTEPRVTRAEGEGDFLVEGVKFNMSGDWILRFEIAGPAGGDVATFDVQVGP